MTATSIVSYVAAPRATPVPACPNTACTVYLQRNDAVAESRATVHIATAITSASGDVLAKRDGTVIFRTFRVAPYVAQAGQVDGTVDPLMNGGAGDDGGASPQAGVDGTLIGVVYRNAVTNARTPADAWQARYQNPNATTPAWDR